MSENSKIDLSVYELPGTELRDMLLEHANSLTECQQRVAEARDALGPEGDEVPAELRRSAVFTGSIERLALYEEEARYLARHIPLDKAFMLNATQLLAFKRRWGVVTVDVEKLAWAPRAGIDPNDQAERNLASTATATPRIVMPDGSLVRGLGM